MILEPRALIKPESSLPQLGTGRSDWGLFDRQCVWEPRTVQRHVALLCFASDSTQKTQGLTFRTQNFLSRPLQLLHDAAAENFSGDLVENSDRPFALFGEHG